MRCHHGQEAKINRCRAFGWVIIAGVLASCGDPVAGGNLRKAPTRPVETAAAAPILAPGLPPDVAARNFAEVLARVEPTSEAACRAMAPGINCDFQIGVDMDGSQQPNAYQTVDDTGRPQIVFTIALIAGAQNSDELAFVLGHEAAHHILGHLQETERQAITGAILGGILAQGSGAGDKAVDRAQRIGAQIGALRFSKDHELEADELGTIIAYEAGYDPLVGAAFFSRLPDPGDGFLNTHPANAERQAIVAATYAQISGN